jgi:hypothetical protein
MTGQRLLYPLMQGISGLICRALQSLVRGISYRSGVLAYVSRPDDIFVVSYPKAGTTVLQMMLYQLSTDGDMSIPHIDSVAPWFESALNKGPEYLDRLPSPRIFKTHRPISHLPRAGRYIYVVRSPKDTCVSYYHHLTSLHGASISLPRFVATFLAGSVPWGSWFEHMRRCSQVYMSRKVLLIEYEDVSRNLSGVVDRVADFCGFAPDENKRLEVIERCGFAFMKTHTLKFDPRFAGDRTDKTDFIRKGIVGDWENVMTPGLARMIDEKWLDTYERTRAIRDLHLSFSKTPMELCRGTIQWKLSANDGSVFTRAVDGICSATIFLPGLNDQGITLGDVVHLRFHASSGHWLSVRGATVCSTTSAVTQNRPMMVTSKPANDR